jgi:hypothetical protein
MVCCTKVGVLLPMLGLCQYCFIAFSTRVYEIDIRDVRHLSLPHVRSTRLSYLALSVNNLTMRRASTSWDA